MKKHQTCILIAFLLLLMLPMNKVTRAERLYDEEYKFVFKIDQWMKIKGYENNSFSYVEHNLFQVIEYNNENITLIEISGDVIVHVYNFSLFESIPWIGPIGYYFINPDIVDHYYNLWKDSEDLDDAYCGIIGSVYTEDLRNAENFVFSAELSILIEDGKVDLFYDEKDEEIKEITDDYTLSLIIYVEYDSKGVLLKMKELTLVEGNLIQYKREEITLRVDNFEDLESIHENPYSNFLEIISFLLVPASFYYLRKKYK